jgi:predicted DNA-binding protein
MASKNDNIELGREVTAQARAKEKKGTAVLSVRLSIEELKKLDAASRITGKSIAQLAREALSSYAAFATQSVNVTVTRRDFAISSGAANFVGRGDARLIEGYEAVHTSAS